MRFVSCEMSWTESERIVFVHGSYEDFAYLNVINMHINASFKKDIIFGGH